MFYVNKLCWDHSSWTWISRLVAKTPALSIPNSLKFIFYSMFYWLVWEVSFRAVEGTVGGAVSWFLMFCDTKGLKKLLKMLVWYLEYFVLILCSLLSYATWLDSTLPPLGESSLRAGTYMKQHHANLSWLLPFFQLKARANYSCPMGEFGCI